MIKLTSANLKAERKAARSMMSRSLTKPDLELTNADVRIIVKHLIIKILKYKKPVYKMISFIYKINFQKVKCFF